MLDLDLTHYTPQHRRELESLLASPPWQETIRSGLIEQVKAEKIEPGKTRSFIDLVVNQLLGFNEQRARRLIDRGCRDRRRLLDELSRWPDGLAGRDPVLSFLGLNVTSQCNLDPRCAYCNQPRLACSVGLEGWKGVVEEATAGGDGEGPYIYVTGGEPLLLGEDIWGDDGLVAFATQRGAGVNVNTNAVMLAPATVLRLIKAGLAKLHVSLDAADEDVQNALRPGAGCEKALQGIYNVQLARDLVGVGYPVIHTNCVLTNRNVDLFPGLFAFILEKHKQTADRDDPFYNDLFPHVIPVGGAGNAHLRPSADDFRRFYEEVWPQVCRTWDEYQDARGVGADQKGVLFGYFSNPLLRVTHAGGLEAYVEASAAGRYGELALSRRCYVAPTQAAVTCDGRQYLCGSHAIRGILPVGNVREAGLFDNIRRAISALDDLPQEETCYGCALATLYINQAVETKLGEKADSMLADAQTDS